MQSTDRHPIHRQKKPFKPILVGEARFGDLVFRIEQIKKNGACCVYNAKDPDDKNYTHAISKAWASVRYRAQVLQSTENTTGWKGFF